LHPQFVTDEWALTIGSSTILLTGPGPCILIDPWLAFDEPGAHERRLGALADAGVRADDVDIVVNTHADGIGANVGPDGLTATFPHARYLLPAAELTAVRAGQRTGCEAFAGLADKGLLETIETGDMSLAAGVDIVDLPGHNAGHVGVRLGDVAVIIGHLFLHPAQVANTASVRGDFRPDVLIRTRLDLLARAADSGTVVIGPIWADPGGGRIVRDPDGERYAIDA
jgi:glyoxylase-like metal-dependent hydrolase (beta-lactamase superfamily II)